ncbi:hypothetical protein ILYODFUR_031355, partial [Ilyodon furcidens]
DIYDKVSAELEEGSLLDCECIGGGRIKHDPDAKKIHVYGYSIGYGRANHAVTTEKLKEHYPDYEPEVLGLKPNQFLTRETKKGLILVVFCFIRDRVAGAADSAETPRRPSPQTPPPAPPGGAQGVPRPAERHSPSSVSWAVPWASSRWDVPGTPPKEGVQEASGLDARAEKTT